MQHTHLRKKSALSAGIILALVSLIFCCQPVAAQTITGNANGYHDETYPLIINFQGTGPLVQTEAPFRSIPLDSKAYISTNDLLANLPQAGPGLPVFYFKSEADKYYGPFSYKEGAQLKLGKTLFEIVELGDESFKLKEKTSGTLLGPFVYKDEAKLVIGKVPLVLTKKVSFIKGSLTHSGLMFKQVSISLIRVTDDVRTDLINMSGSFRLLAAQHVARTMPRRMPVPEVSGPAGYNRSNIVDVSPHDIERSKKRCDMKAKSIFQSFSKKNRTKTVYSAGRGGFMFKNIPAGDYIVCCESRVKSSSEEKDSGQLSKPAFWLMAVTLGKGAIAEVIFAEDNVADWTTLFPE